MNETPVAMGEVILRCAGLRKSYYGAAEVPVLRGVDLQVHRGEFVCIVGNSGSGKSTLLYLLGALDAPTDGIIYYKDQRIDDLPRQARDQFRNRIVGFVFQSYHLLPELTTLENVMTTQFIRCSIGEYLRQRGRIRQQAEELLVRVGLGHRLKHRPRELSGGEMQRAAIARALMASPEILLADEPTGNLDPESGESVFELLVALRQEIGLTVLMVTHNHSLANRADRKLCLVNGRIDERAPPVFSVVPPDRLGSTSRAQPA